jgi:predicted Na+-dependent transporter
MFSSQVGGSHTLAIGDTLVKLVRLVVAPMLIGQFLRPTPVGAFARAHKPATKFYAEVVLYSPDRPPPSDLRITTSKADS